VHSCLSVVSVRISSAYDFSEPFKTLLCEKAKKKARFPRASRG
jgi:hypothetical protein